MGVGLARLRDRLQEFRERLIHAIAASHIEVDALEVVRREGDPELLVDIFHLLIG